MINFAPPVIEDKQWVDGIMADLQKMGCEFCFGNIFMWSPIYGSQIAKYKEFFLCKTKGDSILNCLSYSFPAGEGDLLDCINAIKEDAHQSGCKKLEFYGLTRNNIEELEKIMPNMFCYKENRDGSDYIYSTEDLINLSGKKYHSKRNHITSFEKTYNWTYEEITKDNIAECLLMNEQWEESNVEKQENGTQKEEIAIKRAIDNFEALGLMGAMIRIDGKVVAYTFGEKLNDHTFCTHVEKAFSEIRGAYPIINREFAKNSLSEYKFINREEDLGIDGLRQAKLSYNPEILLQKYTAVLKECELR